MLYLFHSLFTAFSFAFCLTAFAGPGNIAASAKVSVSTSLNENYKAANLTDGLIGIDGKGEWACEGVTTDWGYIRFPWAQLDWSQPQRINKVVLYDRPSAKEHIAGGKLLFSDGSVVWVNQLPNDGSGKAISFPAKSVTWVRFVVTDGTGSDLGLSEMEVFPVAGEGVDFVSRVDPYIETNRGRYFFFITGGVPFGMVGAAPHTRNKNQNGGGYNYNENEILGFGQIHDWMMSGVEIMPTTTASQPSLGEPGWKARFNHDDEIVQPGYHRVFLQDHKIRVEQTATDRVSFYRFQYLQASDARIIINLGGYLANSTMENAVVTRISDTEIEGSFSSVKRYWGGPKEVKLFFVIRFDKPFKTLNGWKGSSAAQHISAYAGDSLRIAAEYSLEKGDVVQMKTGLSYTSIANARNNLDTECTTWNFDDVKNSAQQEWNTWLGKMEVKGGTDAQQVKFYTDLWHVLLGRHKTNDVSGDYPDRTSGKREGTFTDAVFKVKRIPKDANGKLKFNMYNSDAFWLSHWNLNILWGLAWPEVMDEFSASMIEYANNGYLLPRGPSGGGYSYIMTSSPTSNLIVSTYMKGLLKKVDAKHAYEVVRRNHLPGGMLGSKEEIEFYTKHGYWPNNAGISIEAHFQDWGIAQMAARLARKKDVQFFTRRANGWPTLFHPQHKLLFPKNEKGAFVHNDPLSGQGWVEANAWQATWGLSHALPQLAQLMGGADTFATKLNYAFEQSRASDYVYGYTEGYVSYANQPGCSNAHVFSYVGKPWLTQYWVRRVQEQAYGGVTPDLGYGGHDEDQGQMGGVSALMSIGLFSVTGNQSQTPYYEITSPIFDEVKIHLDNRYYSGKQFTIRTNNNGHTKNYIQSAKLNGQDLPNFWFTHEAFAKGGELELWLGDEPNKAWGVQQLPPVN
ncbi:glycoside hydrolase family 92 protein [Flavisolibacter sp. BT320]|nr:glycoside hydrolase family 92 protein [Flavisolibacter longurius]